MSTVIICNRLSHLRRILPDIPGPLEYLNLAATRESLLICDYLSDRPDTLELSRAHLFRQRSEAFRGKYIEFLGHLNAANRSREWWAMAFTNKNPLLTSLCRDTAHLLLIADLARSNIGTLVVITGDRDLGHQVAAWGKGEGVSVINAVARRRNWKSAIKAFTPLGVVYYVLLTLWISLRARRFRLRRGAGGRFTVVTSPLHLRSLAEPGKYRDVYFGELVEHLAGREEPVLVFGLFHDGWRQQLSRIKSLRSGVPVIPIEAYLTSLALFQCTAIALKSSFRLPQVYGNLEIDGVDLSVLLKRYIREAHWSGSFFMDLRMYYCAKQLARSVKVAKCIYPYENQAWEKMLVLGIKDASPGTRLVGYQHAALTPSHTNFLLQEEEARVVPLPDTILTTGTLIKNWLENEGHFPQGMFKTSCALRRAPSDEAPKRKSEHQQTRVLAALGASVEEDVHTLVFLEKAFAHTGGYDLRIRPYPTRPLDAAQEIAPLSCRDFYNISTGSLADDLGWADVVLYSSTTVGLEAVAAGIPAVHLDLGDFLDTDPMFGWDDFKWPVREPAELVDTIKSIRAIPDTEFKKRQREGFEYVSSYLTPVSAAGLQPFLEA